MERTQLCSLETIGGVKCKEDISGGERGEGNEVGERYDARGRWRKRPGGVISSSPGGNHLTDRLREASGRRVGVEE